MEEDKERANISGIIKILKFPLINQSLEINAHLGGVSKIFLNKSIFLYFQFSVRFYSEDHKTFNSRMRRVILILK